MKRYPHFEFHSCRNGDINFSVCFDGRRARVYADCVWDPFQQFLRWLEAITIGVDECAWRWDACGPDFELRYFHVRDYGRVVVRKIAHAPKLAFLATQRDIVKGLYISFVAFTRSPLYVAKEWEDFPAGGWYGTDLRKVRSPRVEQWLAETAQ